MAKGAKEFAVRFVCVNEPVVLDGSAYINGVKVVSLSGIKPVIEKVGYNNQQSKRIYAYTIDYSVENASDVNQTFEFII